MGVIMIGFFDGKGSFNVIKDVVELEGDVCYMNIENCDKMDVEIYCIVIGMEVMFGVMVELMYMNDYLLFYNDLVVIE